MALVRWFEEISWLIYVCLLVMVLLTFLLLRTRRRYLEQLHPMMDPAHEQKRTRYTLTELLLTTIIVSVCAVMFSQTELVAHYLRHQVSAGFTSVLQDPSSLSLATPGALSRSAFLARGTTIRGPIAEKLNSILEEGYYPVVQGPIRRHMLFNYHFRSTEDPEIWEVTATYTWDYEITDEAIKDSVDIKQKLHMFIPKVPGVDISKFQTLIKVDDKKIDVQSSDWRVQEDVVIYGAKGKTSDQHLMAEIPIRIQKGKAMPVVFQVTRRMRHDDYEAVSMSYPTDGADVHVSWTPEGLLHTPRVDVFTLGRKNANSKLEYFEAPKNGYASWTFKEWIVPQCGLILTWSSRGESKRTK